MRIAVEEWAIFSDFDGTITLKDSTNVLVDQYGAAQNKRDEELFISGKATNREVISRHFDTIRPSSDIYYDLFRLIPIDPGFLAFYDAWKSVGGSFIILTGNAVEAVNFYLTYKKINGIAVYGNHISEQDGVMVFSCGDAEQDTLCKTGSCAFCKSAKLEKARQKNKKIMYIGDGLTDLCAAKHADLLFAKSVLADYCEQNAIEYQRFKGFIDIHQYIFGCSRAL